MKKIILGCDHGGFALKEQIKTFLTDTYPDLVLEDVGCDSTESCDYPLFGKAVAEKVVAEKIPGILICGSGVGISIAANRVKGARAVLANSTELARLGREHNGANILAMGERTTFIDSWEDIVRTFLETAVDESDRHERRRRLLDA